MKYAGVIVDISHEKLDKTFCYSIPDEMEAQVEIGSRVNIPFGGSHRTGYVVDIMDIPDFSPDKIRPISGIVPKSTTANEKMIKLAYWMKTNYGSTINAALKTVIPVKEKIKEEKKKNVMLLIPTDRAKELAGEFATKKKAQARALMALSETPGMEYSFFTGNLKISPSTIKSMEDAGYIQVESVAVSRNVLNVAEKSMNIPKLNNEQKQIVDDIVSDYNNGDMTTCLIKGVTGSGKTEVYMSIISRVIESGRQVIMLIPEISLTYQMVMRFYSRFGDIVSIVNSRLSKGEKYDRFAMASQGKIKIMIGPRSALFTPFNNLGMIIIDEEHENAYQCENVPKYHARQTAIELAKMNNAKVILGSATPSIDSYYKAKKGEYRLYELKNRAGNAKMPSVEVVDLRDELRNGNRSIFSDRLATLIRDRLNKKQQIMLFLNRRGYLGFINCRDCGHVIQCPHCAVSLTQHNNGKLICHYCGYETDMVKKCPECGGIHIGTFKAGTQKVEEETRRVFPDARILRMDFDTTRGKEGHSAILQAFANKEADILIGTQMIVKGHDFADVTLMGILLADGSLHSSDYKAAEITFDLLTQAAGRTGRADTRGNVVIQTYDPEHYSIKHAALQDYEGFYKDEIAYRQMMDYPPISHMMSIRVFSADENLAIELSGKIKELIGEGDGNLKVIGPANASIYRINDIFYRMLYCKHNDYEALTKIKDIIEQYMKQNEAEYKNCQIQFDFR